MYGNEPQVAQALAHFIKTSGTPRSEIYLTTKWNPPQPLSEPGVDTETVYNELRTSYDLFVTKHGLEYIDLALVHQSRPGPEGRANHWRAMVRAQKEGWVKDIGVSNQWVPSWALPTTVMRNTLQLFPLLFLRSINLRSILGCSKKPSPRTVSNTGSSP